MGIDLVKEIFVILGCDVSKWFVIFFFWIIFKLLLGSFVLVKILVIRIVVWGVNGDGLNIIVFL